MNFIGQLRLQLNTHNFTERHKMSLRDYQIEAQDAVLTNKIGQIISPTGTGKSIIQGAVFESLINIKPGFGIYVILTPRIMLTNQLMQTVGNHLIKNTKILALTIHSSSDIAKFDNDSEDDYIKKICAEIGNFSTTNSDDVVSRIEDAIHKNLPLLICCTYDSTPTLIRALLHLKLKADQVLCDEAHYIVEKQFNKNITDLKPFTNKIHFFTATQKITNGDLGNGMNNEDFYGPVIFRRTPKQMIEAGYMVRPRLHIERTEDDAPWSKMVADAFEEHQKHVSYNAKMLVCCNGTKTIEEISKSSGFKEFCKKEEITLFSISSAYGATINGIEFKRSEFLEKLNNHKGKAIILHISILTEGIDVPDITGVMFIRNMGLVRFLQSLGRATRVLKDDNRKPTDDFEFNSINWIKPYAWVIVAEKLSDHDGKTANIETIIKDMRAEGFEPTEEVIIAIDRAKNEREEIKLCNKKAKKVGSNFADLFDIQHEIEIEKFAALTDDEALNQIMVLV